MPACLRRIRRGRPARWPAGILLHGWPYDIHSYADVAPRSAAAGYRVIVPYLRGYGTTRFLSDATRPQRPAVGPWRVDAIDAHGRARHRVGDRRRLRLGCAHGQRRRRALARRCKAMVSVSGYLIGSQAANADAAAASGRALVVVPVLLRHRTRPGRLRQVPARLRQAHLAHRVAAVELRRRDLRSQRRRVRQPRPRRHRDPQLPLAARPGARRAAVRRARAAARQRPGHHRADHHPRR